MNKLLLPALGLFVAMNSVMAQTESTWSGGTGTGNFWTTAGNWSPSGVPGPNDSVLFGSPGTSTTIWLSYQTVSDRQAGSITLLDTNPRTRFFRATNGNGTLTLNGVNGILLSNASTSEMRFTNNVYTSGGTTVTNTFGLVLNATGDIYARGLINIASVISGNHGFNKTGAGTLTLRAANTYSGDTHLKEGTIGLTGIATFGNGEGTLYLEGGTIDSLGTRNANNPISNPIVLSGDTIIQGNSTGTGTRFFYLSADSIDTTGGTLMIRHDGGQSLTSNFRVSLTGGGFDLSRPIVVGSNDVPATAGAILDFNSNSSKADQVVSGDISGVGMVMRSAPSDGSPQGGKTILTGNNTYSGGTVVDRGSLWVNNTVGSGTGTGAVTVNSGGTLGGSGSSSGPVTINSGGTISAGDIVGSFGTGNQIWNGGGINAVEVKDFTAIAGVGYDLLNVIGGLTINATPIDRFIIDLRSLTSGDAVGAASGFDPTQSYSLTLVKTTDGILLANGELDDVFDLRTSNFSNDLAGGAFFLQLANGNNDLTLNFAPVPEPGTSALLLMGAAVLARRVFRKQ